jgi:putative DNA primase/helicase
MTPVTCLEPSSPARKLQTTYDYTDEKGAVLFQVVRWIPKGFSQRRPKADGGWTNQLADVRRVLYQLQALADASRIEEPIFVVEGEKDADRLQALGVLATTSPMGAGHWRPEYSTSLRGRDVFILPDNDEPGERHANQVARSLVGVAKEIRVIRLSNLPPKGDVSDWLDAGHTLDDLRKEVYRSDLFQPSTAEPPESRPWHDFPALKKASELRGEDLDVDWIWRGIVARGAITMLSAHPKAGKSTLLGHLLAGLERGEPVAGLPTSACRVLFVSEESERVWAARRQLLGLSDHCHFLNQAFIAKPTIDRWFDFLGVVRDHVLAVDAELVIFDTISSLWPVVSENDAAQVQGALMPLVGLVRATNCGLFISHHLKKSDGLEGTGFRGSSALGGFVDVLVELRRVAASIPEDRRRKLTVMGRLGGIPPEIIIRLNDQGTGYERLEETQEFIPAGLAEQVRRLLPDVGQGLTFEEILTNMPEQTRPRRQELVRVLREGTHLGTWFRTGVGVKGQPWRYTLKPSGNCGTSTASPRSDPSTGFMSDEDYARLLQETLAGT